MRQVLQAQHCPLILLRFLYFFISLVLYFSTLTHMGFSTELSDTRSLQVNLELCHAVCALAVINILLANV